MCCFKGKLASQRRYGLRLPMSLMLGRTLMEIGLGGFGGPFLQRFYLKSHAPGDGMKGIYGPVLWAP